MLSFIDERRRRRRTTTLSRTTTTTTTTTTQGARERERGGKYPPREFREREKGRALFIITEKVKSTFV